MACSSPLYGYRRLIVNNDGAFVPGIKFSEEFKAYYPGLMKPGERHAPSSTHILEYYVEDNKFHFMQINSKAKIKFDRNSVQVVFSTPEERYHYFQVLSKDPHYQTALIPCGRCLECRLEYSRQWANRQMLEAASSENNWFLTLTYDDEHLPKNEQGYPTLVKSHVKKFIKDLRRYFEYHYNITGIRFFACGEYGETTARPHYHVNIFNCPLQDLQFLFQKNTKSYFDSPSLDKIWNKGFVVVGELNWDTAAYVARYVVKKAKGATSSVYQDLNIQPEFCQMSTHPGIAREYYDEHKDTIYKYDKITVPGGKRVRPSHYYDKLYDIDDPCSLSDIKDKRISVAEASQELQLKNTTLDPLEYQKICHDALLKKIKSLKRDVI